jgi:hypothetical protein
MRMHEKSASPKWNWHLHYAIGPGYSFSSCSSAELPSASPGETNLQIVKLFPFEN